MIVINHDVCCLTTPIQPLRCNGYVEACGDSPEEGYTADYVPEAMPSLDDVYDTELIEGDDTLWINNRNATMECSLYLGESRRGKFRKKLRDMLCQNI